MEFSLRGGGGPEGMHNSVLADSDARPLACKLSLDVGNAHNEFDRSPALKEVEAAVPDMLPWERTSLWPPCTHVHLGRDGQKQRYRRRGVATKGTQLLASPYQWMEVG